MSSLNTLLNDELDSIQSALDLFISLVCILLLELAIPATPQAKVDGTTQGKSTNVKELVVFPSSKINEFINADGDVVKEFAADKIILALDENMSIKLSLHWQKKLSSKAQGKPLFIKTIKL
ncbi:hypothetical protein WNY63_15060 [Pseudoalteromonas neustonica]|uniref:Uncharacterized protein n=1 Tax=Pseudoalteromonas neustonica TaxID=1840331 RepID=A0ABU9U4S3_9GAMM